MQANARGRRLFWPALTTALLVALGVALGVWQLERLQWKLGILASIDRAEAAPPVPLGAAAEPFQKVVVHGTAWDSAHVARYGSEVRATTQGPEIGAQIVMPLLRKDAPPVLVDRGWLPDSAGLGALPADTTVTGYVHPAETLSWFAPGNDFKELRFWSLDPAVIGPALGHPTVAPFTLVALGPDLGPLRPAHALPRPPNDHLGYALTWFSLSALALVVFIIFARQRIPQKDLT